jgi:glycosyltransferase involved in cell wall biosynthesis
MKNKLLKITSELRLSNKFIFTGRVPYESVPLYINASEMYVLLLLLKEGTRKNRAFSLENI